MHKKSGRIFLRYDDGKCLHYGIVVQAGAFGEAESYNYTNENPDRVAELYQRMGERAAPALANVSAVPLTTCRPPRW